MANRDGLVPESEFVARSNGGYYLLPFRFERLGADRCLVTNLVGEYAFLSSAGLKALVGRETLEDRVYNELKSKHFLFDPESRVSIDLLAAKYRTRQAHLPNLASLHIFVITRRCNHACAYCQVISKSPEHSKLDMTLETARHAIDFMFSAYSSYLKVEFQGGEPLLNLDCVKYITETCRDRAEIEKRTVEFVLCTNLSLLTSDVIGFCRDYKVCISTSLDGPESVHNANRVLPKGNSYGHAVDGIKRCQEELGVDSVSALMTTTRQSFGHANEIVDEYIRNGLTSLFVRSLNPYGLAARTEVASYSAEEWTTFYRQVLSYILHLNRSGFYFREDLASILLRRAMTNSQAGFVDLQSPTGAVTAVVVYDHDGKVYASDESRMLAAMGDETFCLGNVFEDTYDDVLGSEFVVELLGQTMLEGVPWCSDCAFQLYCGADPVRHYREQKDFVGHKALSRFCRKQRAALALLFGLIAEDRAVCSVFENWV